MNENAAHDFDEKGKRENEKKSSGKYTRILITLEHNARMRYTRQLFTDACRPNLANMRPRKERRRRAAEATRGADPLVLSGALRGEGCRAAPAGRPAQEILRRMPKLH